MKLQKAAVGLIAAAALLVAVPSASLAAKSHPAKSHPKAAGKAATKAKAQRAILLGSLTSISTSSVTIAGTNGSTTVAVGAKTRYIAHTQAAAIAGLKTGDQVVVTVVPTTSGPTASAIIYDTVPFGIGVKIAGTVASSTATSLTVTTPSGQTITLTINSSTKITVNGTAGQSGNAIPANQPVVVAAEAMTNGSIVARAVVVGQKAAKAQRVVIRGTISAIGTSSLTIAPANNAAAVVVQLNAQTRFFVGRNQVTAAPAFTVNQRVVVLAVRQTDGTLVATAVQVPAK